MEEESQFRLFQEEYDLTFDYQLSQKDNQKQQMEINFNASDNQQKPIFRAINPFEQFRNLPQGQRQGYLHLAMTDKRFNGVQGLFGLQQLNSSQPEVQQFLNIDTQIFRNQIDVSLNKFFDPENGSNEYVFTKNLNQLYTKITQVQKKTFNSINFNKTIGPAFYDHFQNFTFLQNQSPFVNQLENSLKNFIEMAKKLKIPGPDLIINIYEYWMKMFREFVNQIWKYSQKYTLNFFKKGKNNSQPNTQFNSQANNSDFKSSTSSQIGQEKQKRKQWNQREIDILNQMIESDTIFSNAKLKQLSEQFGRTTSSISSKIQKIIRQKKLQNGKIKPGDMPLLQKIIQVLNNAPQGLNKDQVIIRINQNFQMGFEDNWKKSVTQLLSSNKQIIKKKGVYSLLGNHHQLSNNQSVSTFRQKIIQCLLRCQNQEADLKEIVEKYLDLYGLMEGYHIHDQEKIKHLQASISKTLCRYDIFDKSKSRTLYFYSLQKSNNEMQVELFLS